jgi:hypothetical protein
MSLLADRPSGKSNFEVHIYSEYSSILEYAECYKYEVSGTRSTGVSGTVVLLETGATTTSY